MGIEFAIAAHAAEVSEEEDVVEVPIGDKVFLARRPTVAQAALMSAARGRNDLGSIFLLVKGLLGEEALDVIEELIWTRRIDLPDLLGGGTDLNPGRGLIDSIFEEFSERPTKPSTDSSSSQKSTGRRSTVRSPGKGSTRSSSPSTDS